MSYHTGNDRIILSLPPMPYGWCDVSIGAANYGGAPRTYIRD